VSDVDEHIHFLRGLFDETSESGERCNEIADILSRLRAELAQRTLERDEARRELCHYKFRSVMDEFPDADTAPQIIAENRGWDCFDAKEAKP